MSLKSRRFGAVVVFVIAGLSAAFGGIDGRGSVRAHLPPDLHGTGLYAAPGSLEVDPAHLGFAPQYPLWSDGAAKRRWISLPLGTRIDARDPDAWEFPVGTRFWKEFAFDGRPVETRYMELLPGGDWAFAAYAWDVEGRTAALVPEAGRRFAHDLGQGRFYAIPSTHQCAACHLGGDSAVLGFAALQLSDDRDPNALHVDPAPAPGITLGGLLERDLITNFPDMVPRIPARSATERAALGYLHGNCGHCHNVERDLAKLALILRQPVAARRAEARASTLRTPMRRPPAGIRTGTIYRIEAGAPDRSALLQRIASRHPSLQMPPIATALIDAQAVDLITRWITEAGAVPARDRHYARREDE